MASNLEFMQIIKLRKTITLDDYAAFASLHRAVEELRSEATILVPRLGGRNVWMLNSAARGGGVAEMLPTVVSLLRELGVKAHWAVMDTNRAEFFKLTKRVHNLIHGQGDTEFGAEDVSLYEKVSNATARELRAHVRKDDILVVHDPQPLGAGQRLKRMMMTDEEWAAGWHVALGVRFNGDALEIQDERGRRVQDDTLLLLLNAHHEPIPFILPAFVPGARWAVVFDTNRPELKADQETFDGQASLNLEARSLKLLRFIQ